MKLKKLVGLSSALVVSAMSLVAQEANPAALGKQLEELLRIQRQQAEQIESLKKQIEILKGQPAIPGAKVATPEPKINELEKRVTELSDELKKDRGGKLSVELGFVGEGVFSYASKGSDKTGSSRPGGADFFLRSAELSLEASVDPFAKAYLIANATDDNSGEAALGVEEAALVLHSLPLNTSLRAGRFFGEFGRLSSRHEHDLPFVNRPLALENFVGGESKTDGLEVSYLFPFDHYLNLTLGVGNQFGDAQNVPGKFRNFNELDFWGRLSTTFDFGQSWSLDLGASGLLADKGDNRGGALVQPDDSTLTERRRRLTGLDLTLRYHPPGKDYGFEWGSELLYNSGSFDFDPDATALTGDEFRGAITSRGVYSYGAWKIDRRWSVGFLYDWVQSVSNLKWDNERYSPYFTYRPSEFQMWRLQYSRTVRGSAVSGQQDDHALFLQWTYILGKHSHGFRAR